MVAAGVAVACGAVGVAALGQAQVAPERATAFPMPGSPVALPGTQISLRGVATDKIGAVEVSGSRSGAHPGELRPHPDGQGASFVPQSPFAQGETVTVRTSLDIPGGRDGDFTFTVARRPSPAGGGGAPGAPPRPRAGARAAGRRGRSARRPAGRGGAGAIAGRWV